MANRTIGILGLGIFWTECPENSAGPGCGYHRN